MAKAAKAQKGEKRTRANREALGDASIEQTTEQGVINASPLSRARNRPKRTPVGTGDRLKFSQRPGYYRRVVNDDPNNPGRIQQHIDAGYEFVYGEETGGPQTADDPSKLQSKICKHVGGGIIGYLMEQPIAYRNEDLALQHAQIDSSEEDMQENMVHSEGRYGKAEINQRGEERLPNPVRTPIGRPRR